MALNGKISKLVELRGYSPYDLAVINGFEGTEEEWLASLKGEKGDKGDPGVVYEPTNEIYFDITAEGVISLKPEYRGSCPQAASSLTYAISDNGIGNTGSKNAELPEVIVIPEKVGNTAVTALAGGMFLCNLRIKRLTLPGAVRVIPSSFCYGAHNLCQVDGTEQIEELKSQAFTKTGLRSANFPNLIKSGSHVFRDCSNLITADFGSAMDMIAAIPKNAFLGCANLTELRCGENITTVNEGGFLYTHRLKTLPFLPKLKNIGKGGILCSRVAYDWDSLEGCTFTSLATPKQFFTTDYWASCTYEPCYTALQSTFEQHNPRWADMPINGSLTAAGEVAAYKEGCSLTSAAMVYSALAGVDLLSPEEFVALAHESNSELVGLDYDLPETAKAYLEALDCTVEHLPECSAANLKKVYDALAGGALVLAQCVADYNGNNHVIVLHGINASGELMVTDSSNPAREIGIYEAVSYPMPVQNRVRADCYFLIVTKEK